MRLTLRTLLAYLDDTLEPAEARQIGLKVAENPQAQELIDRIKRVSRSRGLATPPTGSDGSPSDPNSVADYLSDTLSSDAVAAFEQACLDTDVHLAEVAACHQILTLVLAEQVRVPPSARRRMYELVKGRESIPTRRPGATIPVGGVFDDPKKPIDPDDADASLLLGMTQYSRSSSPAKRVGMIAAVLGLAAAAIIAAIIAFPSAEPARFVEPTSVASAAKPVAPAIPIAPPPKPADTPAKPVDPPIKPVDPPIKPNDPTIKPNDPPIKPNDPPKKDLTPPPLAPKTDRVMIGKLDKAATTLPVVVKKTPGGDSWVRVPLEDPGIVTTDRLTALPGYKAKVAFDSEVVVELWGNLPEFLPAPVAESSITPYLPADGFDAEVILHVGRIYLETPRPKGAKIRVRVGTEIWDITLTDGKAAAVVEVVCLPVPGATAEPAQVLATLAVQTGTVIAKVRTGEPATLARGDDITWDSKGGKAVIRTNAEAKEKANRQAFYSRFPPNPDGARAKLVTDALDDFSKNLLDGKLVRATFDEALAATETPTPKGIAAARVAIFTFAALGDAPGVVDALTDPNRPYIRQAAADALRTSTAADPAFAERFRQLLLEKARVPDDQIDVIFRLIRGLSDKDRANLTVVEKLIDGLSSGQIAIRELSFVTLTGFADPTEKGNEPLFRYDAGAPPEARAAAIKAWEKRLEEVKKKAAEPPK